MRIVITGASGLIGTALRRRLVEAGHDVVQLVRRTPSGDQRRWDPAEGELDPGVLTGADAVISLGGAGIGDERWSDERKKLILDSRVGPTSLLAETMAGLDSPPQVFLSGSAIGFYGDRGDERLDEESPAGRTDDFLVQVTTAWEEAAAPAAAAGIRTVYLRTGIVLDDQGGALGKMLPWFKAGVGGPLGKGRQWWSWIGLEDEVRAIVHLLDSRLAGPVNLTSPNPATNAEFTQVLGKVLRRPTLLPIPKFAVSALYGAELMDALAYTSARVAPARLLSDGFEFTQADLREALETTLSG